MSSDLGIADYEEAVEIGSGGFGVVYRAWQPRFKRAVAIKILSATNLDEHALTRFERELEALGTLSGHPNIVTVHDAGFTPAGVPYIVMGFETQGSIADRLQARGPFPWPEAVSLGVKMAGALETAHGAGILHGDVKPENILVSAFGEPKLADFGIAQLRGVLHTQTGSVVASVPHAAPELLMGLGASVPSDVYALGSTLYTLILGRPAFVLGAEESLARLIYRIAAEPVPDLRGAEVAEGLCTVLERAMAKDPAERHQSAEQLGRELQEVQRSCGYPPTELVVPASAEVVAAVTTTVPVGVKPGRSPGGHSQPPPPPAPPLSPEDDRTPRRSLVGRRRDLAELHGLVDEALTGHGALVFLTGEAGIGKTRLAEDAAAYGRQHGLAVHWGVSWEGTGQPSFWPWTQVVRSMLEDDVELRSTLGGVSDAGVLSPVLGAEVVGEQPSSTVVDAEAERFRFFDALTNLLVRAARRRPAVVVLDDLQWADVDSLLYLGFLARRLRNLNLVVVGTYRDLDVRPGTPRAEAVAALARVSHRIALGGLGAGEVRRLIEIVLERTPTAAEAESIVGRSDGNPLFATELARLVTMDGGAWSTADVPTSIRDVIQRRLNVLEEKVLEVLRAMAALGADVDLGEVAVVLRRQTVDVLTVLEPAVAARIVVRGEALGTRYSFSHPLLRETIEATLSPLERARLHRDIATELEQLADGRPPPAMAARLARHFGEAAVLGEHVKAVSYSVAAAEEASRRGDHNDAVRHYQRAVTILEAAPEPDVHQRLGVLLRLGEAQERAGVLGASATTMAQAVDLAETEGSSEEFALAVLGSTTAVPRFANSPEMVALVQRALVRLPGGDSVLRARLLSRVSVLTSSEHQERIHQLGREALAMARRLGDPATLVRALSDTHHVIWTSDAVEERFAVADETVELAERVGDDELAVQGHLWRFSAHLEQGQREGVDQAMQHICEIAGRRRLPALQLTVTARMTTIATIEGRYDDAATLVPRLSAMAEDIGSTYWRTIAVALQFEAWAERPESEEHQYALKFLLRTAEEYPRSTPFEALVLGAMAAGGERAAAARRLRSWLPQIPRRDYRWRVAVLCMLANAACRLEDRDAAEAIYPALRPHEDRVAVIAGGAYSQGAPAQELVGLASLLGRWDDAERHCAAAVAISEGMRAEPWLARTAYEHARVLLRRGRPEDAPRAAALVTQARTAAVNLGMTLLVSDIDRL